MEGIFQKMLYIDLNKNSIGEERLPAAWYRDSLGGLGVGVQYLLEDLRAKNPLLDDPIFVVTGPLTGTPLPGTSKASLISYRRGANKLTLDSVEGRFPAYVKLAGFDGLVITGKAREPVGLYLSNKESKILDASPSWGKDIFALSGEGIGNGQGGAILAIGPAGEKGHPCASVVSDRWIHGRAGIGEDFGLKRLKMILVEPDSELAQNTDVKGLPPWIISYLRTHFKRSDPDEMQKSCLGCVKGCGRFDSQQNLLFPEEDFEKLRGLMPRGPDQESRQNHYLFYRECLRLGLEPFQTADWVSPLGIQTDLQEVLQVLMTQPPGNGGTCLNTRSWEEAFLNLQGWYRDDVFKDMESIPQIPQLIEKEIWAVLKNCLPVCERWEMTPEEMVLFVNQVTGSDYSRDDLLAIGNKLMDQVMFLYQSLHYSPVTPQGITHCRRCFPSLLKDHLRDYLKGRKWGQTGFPENA